MSNPFLGEIRMAGFNFAPRGWAFCDGRMIAIAQNEVLYQLIGTTYGGDGQNTFALPNLQSRVVIHQGQGVGLGSYTPGAPGGSESVALSVNQIPTHSHPANCLSAAGQASVAQPQNNYWGASSVAEPYSNTAGNVTLNPLAIGSAGGSQPHTNIQPVLAITFILALNGIYPSPN